jgi:beta-lactamase class A
MRIHLLAIALIFVVSCWSTTFAQPHNLKSTLTTIIQGLPADVGVAVIDLTSGDTCSVNGNKHFPTQSVFKFHIALAALRQVDEGRLLLSQKIHVTKDDYFKTWSVLMREHPEGDVDVTLEQLIAWAVKNSDNVACDLLFEILGGPQSVQHFIKGIGIDEIAITVNEREMHKDWLIPFENWTTPDATARLLKLFSDGKLLKPESNAFLWRLMTDTPNAPKRLKGLLPAGTVVARKPGTGAPDAGGVLGAVNDVGILVLPDGRKVIVAVYVTNARETLAVVEEVIARISRSVFEYYQR